MLILIIEEAHSTKASQATLRGYVLGPGGLSKLTSSRESVVKAKRKVLKM